MRACSTRHPWEATAALRCLFPKHRTERSLNAESVEPAPVSAGARRGRSAPVHHLEGAIHGPCRLSARAFVTEPTTTADRRTFPCHAYAPKIGTTTTTTTTAMTTRRPTRRAVPAPRGTDEQTDLTGSALAARWRPSPIDRTTAVVTTGRNRSSAAGVARLSDRPFLADATATTVRSVSLPVTSTADAPATAPAAADR